VKRQFKTDENLPQEAAELLVSFGFDAVSVLDQKLQGASDPDVLHVCAQEQRTLMTLDLDFADIRSALSQNTACDSRTATVYWPLSSG